MKRALSLLLFASLPFALAADCEAEDVDGDGDGFTQAEGDCDDGDPAVFPGADEACDDRDNDCDGAVDEGCDAPVLVPATAGTLRLGYDVDAQGQGAGVVRAVDLQANAGEVSIGGDPHRGLAYHRVDWQAAGYVLYGVVSIAEGGENLSVTYLYCQGDALTYLYSESFAHHMRGEAASGSCIEAGAGGIFNATLPALRALPEPFDTGIDIAGAQISLQDDAGWIDFAGARYDLLPFSNVDCTDCPGGPWLEIHSILFSEGQACFAILYLYPDRPTYVGLSYGLCLPDLTLPASVSYEAEWSGSLTPVRVEAGGGPRERGLWPRPPRGARP